jgi:2-haloacid dehalogenase
VSDQTPLDFDSFRILSFDCYGTLIDWESGLLSALTPILERHGCKASSIETLEAFAALETRAEEPPFKTYAEVLREVVDGLGRKFGFTPNENERRALASSLGSWPPFPDTRLALDALRTKYRLAIISNVDDDLFAATAGSLGIPFDWVVTAQQIGSYKPSHLNFQRALERFGAPKGAVLHVAQSLFHDIAPAGALGLKTVWVDRRGTRPDAGATPRASALPDVVVPDLKSLALLAGVA